MATSTTIVSLGRIGSSRGEIAVSYFPDSNNVFLSASEPADKRKAGVTVLLSSQDMHEFWGIISELDRLTRTKINSSSKVFTSSNSIEFYEFPIGESTLQISSPIIKDVLLLLAGGKDEDAILTLCFRLSWLSQTGAMKIVRQLRDTHAKLKAKTGMA